MTRKRAFFVGCLLLLGLGLFFIYGDPTSPFDTQERPKGIPIRVAASHEAAEPSREESRHTIELSGPETTSTPTPSKKRPEDFSSIPTPPDVIEGLVLRGSKPVSGGTVRLLGRQPSWINCFDKQDSSSLPEKLTSSYPIDFEGKFKIAGLEEGNYCLEVDSPPILPRVFNFSIDLGRKNERKILVLGDGKVYGTVYDGQGRPVANAKVSIQSQAQSGEGLSLWAETNSQGAYSFEDLPAAHLWIYCGSLDSKTSEVVERRQLDLKGGESRTVDFGLAMKLAKVSGRLRDREGKPFMTKATIILDRYEKPGDASYAASKTIYADGDGKYEATLEPGFYLAHLLNFSRHGAKILEPKFEVRNADFVYDITLLGTTVRGNITLGKGSKAQFVCLVSKDKPYDRPGLLWDLENGPSFRFVSVPPGRYRLFAKATWTPDEPNPEPLGEQNVEIREDDVEVLVDLSVE